MNGQAKSNAQKKKEERDGKEEEEEEKGKKVGPQKDIFLPNVFTFLVRIVQSARELATHI